MFRVKAETAVKLSYLFNNNIIVMVLIMSVRAQ